jgi:hypothetical protein
MWDIWYRHYACSWVVSFKFLWHHIRCKRPLQIPILLELWLHSKTFRNRFYGSDEVLSWVLMGTYWLWKVSWISLPWLSQCSSEKKWKTSLVLTLFVHQGVFATIIEPYSTLGKVCFLFSHVANIGCLTILAYIINLKSTNRAYKSLIYIRMIVSFFSRKFLMKFDWISLWTSQF